MNKYEIKIYRNLWMAVASSIDMYNNDVGQESAQNLWSKPQIYKK